MAQAKRLQNTRIEMDMFRRAIDNRPCRQLRLARHSDLADEDQVQWRIQCAGNRQGYRHPAAW